MPTSPQFELAYGKLNTAQKEAVDAIEGPVMVIAGPGTGKTQILTLRIANILVRTDVTPECILALTFTEAGAHAMRKRLAEMIGSRAYKISIYTFHGFANELITLYPERFTRIVGGTPIDDVARFAIFEDILNSGDFPEFRPVGDPLSYVRHFISTITALKRDGVSPQEFKKIVKEDEELLMQQDDLLSSRGATKGEMKASYKDLLEQIKKNGRFVEVFERYEAQLAKQKKYDFDDMINEVVHVLETDDTFRLLMQEKYQYILADEHQDANNSQNRILELLADYHTEPNLFIVGDEKQSIYRFQGASLENFRYFEKKFPSVRLVELTDNYRSTQQVLDSAHALIARVSGNKPLLAKGKGSGETISVYPFKGEDAEARFVVEDIAQYIESGTPAEEIAIIYRNHAQAEAFVKGLARLNISYSLRSGGNLLADDDIAKLLLLLSAINDLNDAGALARACYIDFFGIVDLDVAKLLDATLKMQKPFVDLARNAAQLKEINLSKPSAISELLAKIDAWAKFARNESLPDFLERIVRESGFLTDILRRPGSLSRLRKLEDFIELARDVVRENHSARLTDLLAYIEQMEAHELEAKQTGSAITHGVQLMTAHAAKGLEFDRVYIVRAVDDRWGGNKGLPRWFTTKFAFSPILKSGEDGGKEDDERRLFYVAMTRARLSCTISYFEESKDGKQHEPTRFIADINPELKVLHDTAALEEEYRANPAVHFNIVRHHGPDANDKVYLTKLFLERGLNVSALNNYLACPWKYYYKNLLRLPEPYTVSATFGTVVHASMKDYFNRWKEDDYTDPGVEYIITRFHFYLDREPIPQADYKKLSVEGEEQLRGYFKAFHDSWHANVLTEHKIKGVEFPVVRTEGDITILLRGDIDKIIFNDDETVEVVDYKTGKPMTRNAIEGKTKDATGDYKRQLVFYKLLLDVYEHGRFKMEVGTIDFLKPKDDGKYVRESFVISEEEVAALRGIMEKIINEILDFSFWESTCSDESCAYCKLAARSKNKTAA